MSGLSVNDLISVSVSLSPTAAATQNFGTLLIMGSTANVIDVSQRMRQYSSLASVAADFGTSAPEYLAAALFFGQNPQPSTCFIGRWAQSATAGLLHGGTLSASQQALSSFMAVTSGSVNFTIDGSAVDLTGLNFSAVSGLNGVAAIINTALSTHGTCTWNANYNRFEFVSATTGVNSSVSFGSAGGSGVDISTLIGSTQASGAVAVAGIAAESCVSSVTTIAALSNSWYGLVIAASIQDADVLSVASFIEGLNPRRFFVATTQEANALDASYSSDMGSQLQAAAYTHTACQYSSATPYAGASLFARQATVNFSGNNTTIDLMYKQEPGVTAETLTESQAAALNQKNINVFVNYNNSTAIIQRGTVANGQYIDTIVASDWLQNALQTALFNALYTSVTKIPMTDPGVNVLLTSAEAVLAQAVANGFIAPGVWTGPPLNNSQGKTLVATGQTLSKGYFLYAPPVASLTAAQLGARQSPVITALIKLAGAVNTVAMVVQVSN